jgi:hypothetical protein
MTGFIVSVFPFRNRVSSKEAFEGLELGEGKLSRPVLRGPGGCKAAWLLGNYAASRAQLMLRGTIYEIVPRTDHAVAAIVSVLLDSSHKAT